MKMKWSVGSAVFLAFGLTQGRAATDVANSPGVKWQSDFQAAVDLAGREDRVVMLYFTGSDWCSWCTRLSKEVLEHPSFINYSERNLVPVKLEFPRYKQLSASQRQHNNTLADRFQVRSYPTLVFLDSTGREVFRRGYEQGGGPVYVDSIEKKLSSSVPVTIKRRTEKLNGERSGAGGFGDRAGIERPTVRDDRRLVRDDRRPARDFGPPEPAPLFGGAPAAAPQRYTNLVLKSISGVGNRRFALINNQTLGVGESASVKFEDRSVRVRCDEIRDRSVVVKVDGEAEPREVRLVGPE